jgi:hypothetical protein
MKQTPAWYLFAERLLVPLLFVFSFLAVLFPLTGTDIWWHLAAGREIFRTGTILRSDPFSLLSLGKSWTDLHWFFQLVVFLLWRMGGNVALVIGKCLLFSASTVLLLKAAERHTSVSSRTLRPLAVSVLALLVFAGREFVLMRPVVFSLFFMSLFLYLIGRFLSERRLVFLGALVVIQVFWANSQPLFPLGPLIVACFLAGEGLGLLAGRLGLPGFAGGSPARVLGLMGITLLLLLAASLLTPFGIDGIVLPFKLLFRIGTGASRLFSYNVSENVSPWLLERTGAGTISMFSWVLGTALGSFFLNVRRIPASRLFLLFAMLLPALLANRNLLLFYWVAGPVILANVASAIYRVRRSKNKHFFRRLLESPLLAGLVLATIAFPLGSSLTAQAGLSAPVPFRVPVTASTLVASLPARGNLFNSVRYGGYLIWKLFPERRPFIDGRLVLCTTSEFADYLDVLDHPRQFTEYSRTHDLRTAVLPVALPDRYRPLVGVLYRDPDWNLVYTDGTQTVFTQDNDGPDPIDLSDRQTVSRIAGDLSRRFASDRPAEERAYINLGLLLDVSGNYERAAEILADRKSRMARALLARSYYLEGRIPEALKITQALLKERPDDTDSLILASQIALESGRLDQAIELAGRALEADPYSRAARRILLDIRQAAAAGQEAGKE